jgi:hypothetical protein
MGAWKQFLASDIIVNPFVVNKSFTCFFSANSEPAGYGISIYGSGYYGEEETPGGSSCGGFIDRFLGVNLTTSSSVATQSLFYDTLVFELDLASFNNITLFPGQLLVNYSESVSSPTFFLPTNIRIHNEDLNGFDISSYVNSWTNVEFQAGSAPSGLQIRDNVALSNYSSEITGSSFNVFTTTSLSLPYSLNNKLVEPTPPINITTTYNFNTFNPLTDPTTGISSSQYQRLIYNSIKQLYYTNYISSSTGDNVAQPILIPGADVSGNVLVGNIESPLYDNFLPSTLVPNRFFPTEPGATIGVISISSKLYGDYLVPNSVKISTTITGSGGVQTLEDDGEGNLYLGTLHYGNVIYSHGMIILTNSGSFTDAYGTSSYGEDVYGEGYPQTINWLDNAITCSFSSSMTIYETQYKCTLRESEFNATLNPSAQKSGSLLTVNSSSFYQRGDGTLNNNITGSYFSPYVTTVGLYDEAQNLLAIGKLAQPLPTSPTTDTTILVNIDM